jgi:hypothetical protein
MPREHQFVWHVGVILRKVNFTHETNDNILLEELVTKDFGRMSVDCDFLAECFREVFPEELKALEVLYGK